MIGCNNQKPEESTSDILVAYFSVTGNTRSLALWAEGYFGADIFRIEPKIPYTSEDLKINEPCRSYNEQNDSTARPKIRAKVKNISKYKTIILGYPIWYGEAPKIMYTFIESYNFTDKKIIPFATSDRSKIGESAINLAKSAPNARWVAGECFFWGRDVEIFLPWLERNVESDTYVKQI